MAYPSPYLLIIDRGTASRTTFPSHGKIAVGPVEVRLEAAGATMVVAEGTTALLNGAPCGTSEALAVGDEVSIGEVSFTFHGATTQHTVRAPLDAALLTQRLAEEAERFLRYERPFALLLVEAGGPADSAAMAEAVCRAVRRVDVVGWLSRTELAVIFPETTESAAIPATRIIGSLQADRIGGRAGIVTCPLDACSPDALLVGARCALRSAAAGEVRTLPQSAQCFEAGGIVARTADPTVVRLFELVRRVAGSDIPVLIQGETGAGKEVVAQAVHAWSNRARGPIVAMNCAAIPETLLESELFGHERGAFSGAVQSKPGMLEKASGGTLLLDEVGDLSASAQAKLLRVLETGRVMRVGATQERSVDVRVVSATHRDLEAAAAKQQFRLDLFYRLGAATLLVPPLRERELDVALLARMFLQRACERLQRGAMTLSCSALRRLSQHPWPGNVRELKNLMEYLAASVASAQIEASDLPSRIAETAAPWMVAAKAAAGAQPAPAPAPASPVLFRNIYEEIEELERTRIRQALEHTGGVRVKAAQLIGMPLRTMLTKMKQHGLEGAGAKEQA